MSEAQVVVIGAGSAGIAAAVALKDAGLSALVLDRAAEVGSSWRPMRLARASRVMVPTVLGSSRVSPPRRRSVCRGRSRSMRSR
jgi:cation diffusion facilitator CzcD-associated flavoprotein CzcO